MRTNERGNLGLIFLTESRRGLFGAIECQASGSFPLDDVPDDFRVCRIYLSLEERSAGFNRQFNFGRIVDDRDWFLLDVL